MTPTIEHHLIATQSPHEKLSCPNPIKFFFVVSLGCIGTDLWPIWISTQWNANISFGGHGEIVFDLLSYFLLVVEKRFCFFGHFFREFQFSFRCLSLCVSVSPILSLSECIRLSHSFSLNVYPSLSFSHRVYPSISFFLSQSVSVSPTLSLSECIRLSHSFSPRVYPPFSFLSSSNCPPLFLHTSTRLVNPLSVQTKIESTNFAYIDRICQSCKLWRKYLEIWF